MRLELPRYYVPFKEGKESKYPNWTTNLKELIPISVGSGLFL